MIIDRIGIEEKINWNLIKKNCEKLEWELELTEWYLPQPCP